MTAAQAAFPPPRLAKPTNIIPRAFLGIDLGTAMGHALLDESGRRIESGVWEFPHRGKDAKTDPGARYWRALNLLHEELGRIQREYRLAGVLYEEINFVVGRQAHSAHVWGGFQAILLMTCSKLGIGVHSAMPSEIKKVAVAKGNADKEMMILGAARRWGLDETAMKGDEADALFCAEVLRQRDAMLRRLTSGSAM